MQHREGLGAAVSAGVDERSDPESCAWGTWFSGGSTPTMALCDVGLGAGLVIYAAPVSNTAFALTTLWLADEIDDRAPTADIQILRPGATVSTIAQTDLPRSRYYEPLRARFDAAHDFPEKQGVRGALQEIRDKTNLTWSQIARAVGVQRRSLHYWAKGNPANAANTERLMDLVREINLVDVNDAVKTTTRLLTPRGEDPSVFMELSQRNGGPPTKGLRPLGIELDEEERQRRRGFRPSELIDARHDGVGPKEGEYLETLPLPDQSV